MEIRHLRYFAAVAEELRFGRAAARLHMATSPLSRRIQDLERELGVALFVRRHHKVSLTPAGATLLPLAHDLLERFAQLKRVVNAEIRAAVVGIGPDVRPELRQALLAALAARHPRMEVTLRPASFQPLVDAVLARDLDLALVHEPTSGHELESRQLADTPVLAAVGAGTGLGEHGALTAADLAHMPYASISPDAAPRLYQRIDRLLSERGITGRIILEGHNLAGLAHVVASGKAFTLVSAHSGATFKAFVGEPVRLLALRDLPLTLSTLAVWRADHPGWEVAEIVDAVQAALPPR